MEDYLSQFFDYLLNVLLSTFNQLFLLLGPLLVFALILNLSAILTARMSVRFWGRNLFLYGFCWLGCSVHELSHAFFAIIFGHKISHIELFKPSGNGESLGHVSHSYNKKSIYQKIGNFFIGISPLLSGGIVLFISVYFIFGYNVTKHYPFNISSGYLTDINLFKQLTQNIWNSFLSFWAVILANSGPYFWKPALLVYILYSIGSAMTLSKSDMVSALSGFLWVIVLFLVFNLVTRWMGNFAIGFLSRFINNVSGFYFLLILSALANLLFIVMLGILNLVKGLFVR